MYDSMVKPAFIFDGRNVLPHDELRKIGFVVYALGKPLDPFLQVRWGLYHSALIQQLPCHQVCSSSLPLPGPGGGCTPARDSNLRPETQTCE